MPLNFQSSLAGLSELSSDTDAERTMLAYRYATASAGLALRDGDIADKRQSLWDNCFQSLYEQLPHYQAQDFEIVDYDLFTLDGENLLRGPCPSAEDLKQGRYICLIGAAQLLGRFHRDALQHKLARHFDLPVLNLSIPAAGPDFTFSSKLQGYVENACVTVVQVMSGRSVGCEEYPGGWKTNDPQTGELIPRERVLSNIWDVDREEYERVSQRWARAYVSHYERLAKAIKGPKILTWISPRKPGDWTPEQGKTTGNFGTFPQLIGADILAQISPMFDDVVEVVHDLVESRFRSRVTAAACPFFEPAGVPAFSNRYYPPEAAQK